MNISNGGPKLIKTVTQLINSIFFTANIPSKTKHSIIRPIFKGGVHSQISNYRPVSILPVFDKILETYLVLQFNLFIIKHNLIDGRQYSYQKGKGTNDALCDFAEYLFTNLNCNKKIIVLFLDLTKAFDTIPHRILIEVMESLGFRG